jgi:ABC-type polysaccharide/polyol phosphate export permease
MQRIYFPREFSVLGWSLTSLLDLAVNVVLFLVATPLLGISIRWTAIFIIPLSLILLMMGAGVGFFMGAITVYYRDVRYALPVLMQIWLLASPVAYPLASVPERWRGIYVLLNPVAGVLDGLYRSLAAGTPPDLSLTLLGAAQAAVVVASGYVFYKALASNFADVA